MSGFVCPVCGGRLTDAGSTVRCPAGHSFDRAKEGYVNLLLASRMHSKIPGDSKEMVAARNRFLNGGGYAPFAAELARLCAELARKKGGVLHILDAGCGEGYYDGAICAELERQGLPFRLAGFDISKAAVRLAAKRKLPNAAFAVASSFAAPVESGWADVVLNIFSRFGGVEFRRCVAPGGRVFYAVPTAEHLMGLKDVLYDEPYENPCQQVDYPGFSPAGETRVEDRIAVEGQAIGDLFAMTPYYWKTPAEGSARLARLERLETPIGFRFLLYDRQD